MFVCILYLLFLCDCFPFEQQRQILKYTLRKRGKCTETCTTAAALSIYKNWTTANIEGVQRF